MGTHLWSLKSNLQIFYNGLDLWPKPLKRTSSSTPTITSPTNCVPPSPRSSSEVTTSPLCDARASSSLVTSTETSLSCREDAQANRHQPQGRSIPPPSSIHDDQANGTRYAPQQDRTRSGRSQATPVLRWLPTTIRYAEEV